MPVAPPPTPRSPGLPLPPVPAPRAPEPVASPEPATAPRAPEPAPEPPEPEPVTSPEPAPEPPAPEPGVPLRGAAARIVANMEASIAVPTATSFREVPARLLEVNRQIINGYLGRTRGGKVSFTHLIGYAVVRAIADHMPAMNASYLEGADGTPRLVRHDHVGLGVAVDMQKSDGSRTLLVPCIRDADTLEFREFVTVYEELIRKVRANALSPADFVGTTVSLTNPGTIGTVQSVPRLMAGQGLIVGVGALGYPTEFQAAAPQTIAELGVSKVMTLSSTYDHRIIQGAESGLFLRKVHELLLGENDFYVDALASIGVPYEAVKWRMDNMPADREQAMLEKQAQVNTLVHLYRVRGHLIADLDPLGLKERQMHSELDPATFGLTIWDLEREFLASGLTGTEAPAGGSIRMKLSDILGTMRDAYCRTVGVEYMHVQDLEEKRWIQHHLEGVGHVIELDEKLHILDRLTHAESLERFLATKYVGQKRFGIEGAESAIPVLDALLSDAADMNMHSAVVGMAHRGRLNVLVNIVGKEYGQLFNEFEAPVEVDAIQGSGDVKYHLGQTGTFTSRSGNTIPVDLAANPSHLEAVDPVVAGIARARMDQIDPPGRYPVVPILIHGDAAFAGQGVVGETLSMSQIRGYKVGGTIHLIINNQLGFTTSPDAARSSTYPTDVARTVQAPIFHVNGDDPEACSWVAHLAFEYRQQFNKDVVIDMWCYRRQGHNEGDDPSYTQPLMYRKIDEHPSVRRLYLDALVKRGDITDEDAEAATQAFQDGLQAALEATRGSAPQPGLVARAPAPAIGVLPSADTAVTQDALERAFAPLFRAPDEDFLVHPKLAKQFETREKMFRDGRVDWALAEALAFGTLLQEGHSIRLAGQDSRRGTFSHRHSTLVCFESGREHMPLSTLCAEDTNLWIYDSLLSEYAALGFEYGYSVENPDALVMWEAQFGDFMNGAQIIIDQFIVAAEDKWNQTSGLVMLLPHGYEGQGPEHSSGRIERFLLLAAEDNIQVVNATTAAQYFHVLRRQMKRDVRKPLVLLTPKSLLRAKSSQSLVNRLTDHTFQEVIDDRAVEPADVERVVFTTGKIGPELIDERNKRDVPVAVVRIEQLFPWPAEQIAAALERYTKTIDLVWLQEEPENMGSWNFVKGRFYEAHELTHRISRISRYESGSPATGSAKIHAQEQGQIIDRALTLG
ncbi:MAG: multifunctional oxoglutarate decarboxylase/oxoglutarate dehydrogenase thiamine pyrophosphate-binding subunit/dihydrolipoyllysine-residue succinyltransferase subunit [Acidimicrobiia bacterium]|nr:multifunctional oxoglutarate decarboxylase/oxoglutarate dehydrogenase thiamine pyrophosphate-binding subunit/dihydrolipoyllysine-residue succinyltransferase subunit [Acidimicrobiia bacterium]